VDNAAVDTDAVDNSASAQSAEFRKRLLGFVRKRVPSDADAEDVVQDVLTKLVSAGPITGSVHAWLFTVARNAIIDRSRKRSELPGLPLLEICEAASDDEAPTEVANCLCPMMSVLSTEDRRALERIDMRGESQTEVAQELGISTSGMKSRVQRARERLRVSVESCCEIARDWRGVPTDCEKRPGANCGGSRCC
jgi:RNA polymerase sigma-70 factor (ECF subfamily)